MKNILRGISGAMHGNISAYIIWKLADRVAGELLASISKRIYAEIPEEITWGVPEQPRDIAGKIPRGNFKKLIEEFMGIL